MKRAYVFLIFLGIFTLAYQIGAMWPVDTDEAQEFMDEFREQVEGIDALGIFMHNTRIALPMFIPGFGMAWGLFAAWSTGHAFASFASVTPALAELHPLSVLFTTPFGIMEVTAYSLAISRSYLLGVLMIKSRPIRPHIRMILIEIGIVLGLLIAGGVIEHQIIEMIGETVPAEPTI
ncbi:hypothetical protein CENSYa_1841 [Cenarchaeum symbiosum A]|uniref:Stage II sporulation protein M n=1 Tax=Cenarchaeum symbiosum (strain A) TaxID=414004 RepID=A0RYN4_CENSY|nr:hypothetical protein CENSYa_1841 [Cenarchaeum symbiosum A]